MPMVNLTSMTTKSSVVNKPRLLLLAGAAALGLLGVAAPLAFAETLTYDANGYVDSTARCVSPDTPVVFGSTGSSRIAICKDSSGAYEYRGVRVRDDGRASGPGHRRLDVVTRPCDDGVERGRTCVRAGHGAFSPCVGRKME